MPTGWTIRGGDMSTKLYAIILENGNIICGSVAQGSTISGPTLQSQATISAGTLSVIGYDNSVIDTANRNNLVIVGTGWGQDAAQPGSVMFYGRKAGPVLGLSLTSGGSLYETPPEVTIDGGGGTGAQATAALSNTGAVVSVTIVSPGTGYSNGDPVSFTGGGGSGAVGEVVADIMGAVSSVNVLNHGTGYTGVPVPDFSLGAGTGASGTSNMGFPVASLTLTAPGTGYTSIPTVAFDSFDQGSGAGAVVTGVGTALPSGNYGAILTLTNGISVQSWPAYWTIPLQVTAAPE